MSNQISVKKSLTISAFILFSLIFAVPVADGHLKIIQNNLLKMTKVEILTTPGCTNCSVVEIFLLKFDLT